MERIEQLRKQGKQDYESLKEIVNEFHGTFSNLCKKLQGFNYTTNDTPKYFDINYGVINTTIYASEEIKNSYYVSDMYDIWDDGDGTTFSKMVETVTVEE